MSTCPSTHGQPCPDPCVCDDACGDCGSVLDRDGSCWLCVEPITHGGTCRAYRPCRCHACGIVRVCTPTFDFFTRGGESGPLYCYSCLCAACRLLSPFDSEEI